jgi:DNA-binding SARP family transcriptional activator
MFWGEQDEARARHSLSNALSSLRRALGQRAITTRDADVALAPDAGLDVDALELGDAMEAHDSARAVELYGGPFLDGVHVDDSPAFDQWVSRERRRLETLYFKAVAQQCAALARARRWPECQALSARWLDAEPLSADAALFVLNAIKASGTRAALAQALDEYDRLRARLSREFELAPEPPVRELAARIRDQLATMEPAGTSEVVASSLSSVDDAPLPASPVTASPTSSESVRPVAVPSGSMDQSAQHLADAARLASPPQESSPRRWALWRVLGVSAVGVAVIAIAIRGATRSDRMSAADSARKPVIALLAMQVRADDSTITWLADGLPAMIAGKLVRSGVVDVVPQTRVRAVLVRSGKANDPTLDDAVARDLARRVGATHEVRGAISRDGANLVLDLTIHDVGSGALAQSAALTRGDALALAEMAAARILGAANVTTPGPQLAELETSSVEAYQHYMRAVDAGSAGRWSVLRRELDAALAIDSGFIAVLRDRINMSIVENDSALTRRLRETMARYAHRASEFDRLYQEAYDSHVGGERERSEALARGLVRRYPRDPRASELLEGILGSHGRFEEAERVAIQALALDSLAIHAGTGPCTPCLGYSRVVGSRWLQSDFAGAAMWARVWILTQPDVARSWGALAWTFSYMQRPDSALPLMRRAVSLAGGELWATEEYARMLTVSRHYTEADSVITTMEARREPEWRDAVFDLRSLLYREHGQVRASMRTIDGLTREFPNVAGFADLVRADNERLLGDYAGAERRYHTPAHGGFERGVPIPLPPGSARAFCWHHVLAADAYAPTGDTVMLRGIADTLEGGCVRSPYGRDWRLYHHVRGLVALQGRRYDEAERELKAAVWAPVEGWSRTIVELARAQRGLGRPRDAIATLRTGYATRLDAMGRYVPISELDYWMAQAFAEAGERDSARTYAGYVRSAWRDADPEIRRLLADLP